MELMQKPMNRAESAASSNGDYENGYDDDDSDVGEAF